jgi:hypothetical protein
VTKAEGTTRNQSSDVAVAEKLSALRTAEYFKERAARADVGKAVELLDRAGDEAPREGDEVAPKAGKPPRAGRMVRPLR